MLFGLKSPFCPRVLACVTRLLSTELPFELPHSLYLYLARGVFSEESLGNNIQSPGFLCAARA